MWGGGGGLRSGQSSRLRSVNVTGRYIRMEEFIGEFIGGNFHIEF